MRPLSMSRTLALCAGLVAMAILTACASTDPPPVDAPAPSAAASTPATAAIDADLAEAMEGSETGAAVGLLTSPITTRILRWLGQVVLQAVTNTTLQIQMSTPAPPPVHTPHKPPDSR